MEKEKCFAVKFFLTEDHQVMVIVQVHVVSGSYSEEQDVIDLAIIKAQHSGVDTSRFQEEAEIEELL